MFDKKQRSQRVFMKMIVIYVKIIRNLSEFYEPYENFMRNSIKILLKVYQKFYQKLYQNFMRNFMRRTLSKELQENFTWKKRYKPPHNFKLYPVR